MSSSSEISSRESPSAGLGGVKRSQLRARLAYGTDRPKFRVMIEFIGVDSPCSSRKPLVGVGNSEQIGLRRATFQETEGRPEAYFPLLEQIRTAH